MDLAQDSETLHDLAAKTAYDAIILVGWSWILPNSVLERSEVIGIHPSDLPSYAGGSPIQHQVIDGIENGAVTLFRITPALDAGPVIDREPISLAGHLSDILAAIESASVVVLRRVLAGAWPLGPGTAQPEGRPPPRRRLTPQDSRLTPEQVAGMTCLQLWNAIRCREDPYPNVYLEDETGRLVIRQVEFFPAPKPTEPS
ncbi:MAG: hypothetical protein HY055_16065 [Magnetospirillum sp.]|nr:hypothetical protein [Magnetospirillum sp.]